MSEAYRNEEKGGEVRLDSDGTFSATDVLTGATSGPVDFSGRWDFVDSETSDDFVHLAVEDGGLGKVGGLQLHPRGERTVYFRHDPDGPPTMKFTKVDTP
ncbi:hypothetical protein ACFYW1_15720 [Streptomyces sp. NPDC002669]|uniref:hypothetical protein n=1 Tax=Streptomyces sp. NPDC002669 TaxID=3364658 RepID=UPI0036C59003